MALRVGTNGIKGRRPLSRGLANLFYPADISGGVLWLDASDASTITESGGSVSKWADKFASGNDVPQSDGGLQPTTNISTIGGLNAMNFDGSEYFTTSTPLVYPRAESSMFVVFNTPNQASAAFIGEGNPSTTDFAHIPAGIIGATGADRFYEKDGGSSTDQRGGITMIGAPKVYTVIKGASVVTYVDGVEDLNFTYTDRVITITNFSIGALLRTSAGDLFDGDIGEIIIYDSVLSESDRLRVQAYLNNKWSI